MAKKEIKYQCDDVFRPLAGVFAFIQQVQLYSSNIYTCILCGTQKSNETWNVQPQKSSEFGALGIHKVWWTSVELKQTSVNPI